MTSAAARSARRVVELRIHEDRDGRTNLALGEIGGAVLVVSQFTLYADTRRGRRPGFSGAARRTTRRRSTGASALPSREPARRWSGVGSGRRWTWSSSTTVPHDLAGQRGSLSARETEPGPDMQRPAFAGSAGRRPGRTRPGGLVSGSSWSGCAGSACRRACASRRQLRRPRAAGGSAGSGGGHERGSSRSTAG